MKFLIFFELIKNQEEHDFVASLYNQYSKLMLSAANRILNDKTLAEDAVQISFERIINYLHRIKRVSADRIKAYLIVIAKNAAKDLLFENSMYPAGDLIEYISGKDSIDPLNEIIGREALNELITIICSLKPIYRDVVILKYFCDLSDDIIAGSLNITETAYRQRLSRARKMILLLREEFEEDDR